MKDKLEFLEALRKADKEGRIHEFFSENFSSLTREDYLLRVQEQYQAQHPHLIVKVREDAECVCGECTAPGQRKLCLVVSFIDPGSFSNKITVKV